ncbi:hypothetical protein ACH5RR_006911 [Cinchona calisaya]|uniref:Uncharacterized protein n=1 Tax=Cinchona calisaya TaxID=153742 RepID=A0ABD3AQF6_9GENT
MSKLKQAKDRAVQDEIILGEVLEQQKAKEKDVKKVEDEFFLAERFCVSRAQEDIKDAVFKDLDLFKFSDYNLHTKQRVLDFLTSFGIPIRSTLRNLVLLDLLLIGVFLLKLRVHLI